MLYSVNREDKSNLSPTATFFYKESEPCLFPERESDPCSWGKAIRSNRSVRSVAQHQYGQMIIASSEDNDGLTVRLIDFWLFGARWPFSKFLTSLEIKLDTHHLMEPHRDPQQHPGSSIYVWALEEYRDPQSTQGLSTRVWVDKTLQKHHHHHHHRNLFLFFWLFFCSCVSPDGTGFDIFGYGYGTWGNKRYKPREESADKVKMSSGGLVWIFMSLISSASHRKLMSLIRISSLSTHTSHHPINHNQRTTHRVRDTMAHSHSLWGILTSDVAGFFVFF